MAEIVVTRLLLGIERQVVDLLAFLVARHAKQGPDYRLDAFCLTRIGEHHRAIKAVTVRDRDRRKTAFLRQLRHRLGIDRALQHRIGRQNTERDERLEGHRGNMRRDGGFAKPCPGHFPPLRHPCAGRDPNNAGGSPDASLSRPCLRRGDGHRAETTAAFRYPWRSSWAHRRGRSASPHCPRGR